MRHPALKFADRALRHRQRTWRFPINFADENVQCVVVALLVAGVVGVLRWVAP